MVLNFCPDVYLHYEGEVKVGTSLVIDTEVIILMFDLSDENGNKNFHSPLIRFYLHLSTFLAMIISATLLCFGGNYTIIM